MNEKSVDDNLEVPVKKKKIDGSTSNINNNQSLNGSVIVVCVFFHIAFFKQKNMFFGFSETIINGHNAIVGKLQLVDMFCVALLAGYQYLKLIASCCLMFNVCFIFHV